MPEGLLVALEGVEGGDALRTALLTQPSDEIEIALQARNLITNTPKAIYLVQSMCLTSSEIKHMWETKRNMSANRGTWVHAQCELFLTQCPTNLDDPAMILFAKYINTLQGIRAYRTEWQIAGFDERIAGSIDFVARKDDGSLTLVDWKCAANLSRKYQNRCAHMLSPLENLADCAGIHYRLQLNCYKYILEKYYEVVVSNMDVVCSLHP